MSTAVIVILSGASAFAAKVTIVHINGDFKDGSTPIGGVADELTPP